jgi:hypothetical protein
MQPEARLKKGLINSTSDLSSSHNKTDIPGFVVIKDENGNNAIPPIPLGAVYAVDKKASQIEKVQIVTIGIQTEVPVTGARYTVGIESPKDRTSESGTRNRKVFAYQFGTAGTAATDRTTLYTALKAKINAYVPSYTKAELCDLATVTGDTGITGLVTGDRIGQGTLGATWKGIVAYCAALTATTSQEILCYTLSGTLTAATIINKLTVNDTVDTAMTTAAVALTAGQGLVVYDQAGYFSWKDKLGRSGAPFVYSSPTFLKNRPLLIQAYQSSLGIGLEMLTMSPDFDLTRQNVDAGNIQAQFTQLPVSGYTYTQYIIRYMGKSAPNAIDGSVSMIPLEANIFCREAVNSTYNTKLTTLSNYV